MADLGEPTSYLMLERGAPVFAADGERVGVVIEVRADEGADIFDSVVVARGAMHGAHHLVDADQVEEIYQRGVVLTLDSGAIASLPAPR
jgi:uncharacterized protein YrrD